MSVRVAHPEDAPAIRQLLASAFPSSAEADLVDRLRLDGDVAVELVAIDGAQVVGHVLLSVLGGPIRALALAPVAVAPERQGTGIGHTLIEAAHRQAAAEGWEAIFVLGEPAYYGRFGYSVEAARPFDSLYSGPWFMLLPLRAPLPATGGTVAYPSAFAGLS